MRSSGVAAESGSCVEDYAEHPPTIQKVNLFPVSTPRLYGEPSQHVIVRLTASDGTAGWGEISDVSHLPAMQPDIEDLERVLETLLIGKSVGDINPIEKLMLANFLGTRFHGKACLVRAGISIAIHDLKARLLRSDMRLRLMCDSN